MKVILTLSYHTNSMCLWWAAVSTPQGWGQSIAGGKDLHQPPEAVFGFAPCRLTNTHRTAWFVLQHLQQPLICRGTVYHWLCGTLSRSCLLLLSLIAVQSLTRKVPFFLLHMGNQLLVGHRKYNKNLLMVNLWARRDHQLLSQAKWT